MWGVGNTDDNITGISKDDKPLVFSLERNDPNPFANEAEIRYHIAYEANIALKVFDIVGRVVSTLVNGVSAPGYYSLECKGIDKSGNPLPPGVYFLQMKAGNYEKTSKIIIVR